MSEGGWSGFEPPPDYKGAGRSRDVFTVGYPSFTSTQVNSRRRIWNNSNGIRNGNINPAFLPPRGDILYQTAHNGTVPGKERLEDVTSGEEGADPTRDTGLGEQIYREPLFLCRAITSRPKLAFGITLGLHILMVATTGVLFATGYDILPSSFQSVPIYLRDSEVYRRQLAWINRPDSSYNRFSGKAETEELFWENTTLRTTFIYEKEGGNIFTKQYLQAIKRFEDEISDDPEVKDKYCSLGENGVCRKPLSVIRFFDGTYSHLNPMFDDGNFDNIVSVLTTAYQHPELKSTIHFFLGTTAEINSQTNIAHTPITRSTVYFGGRVLNTSDGARERTDGKDYVIKTLLPKWRESAESGLDGLDLYMRSSDIQWDAINSNVISSMLFIIGSFAFIFLFMLFQTGSVWLTVWGIVSILFSFVSGNLVYNVILDFKYLGIFHVLALFIILGIGADDVFIFTDTWKSLASRQFPSTAHRLSVCYRRAAGSMLVTSLTTSCAFFTSSFSPILAVSSFGTFAGLTVLVNFLSIILFYPCVIVIWHNHWEATKCCGCCGNRSPEEQPSANSRGAKEKNKRIPVRFLSGPYFRFISNHVVKGVVLIAFIGLLATFVYFVTTVEPADQPPQVMKSSHPVEQFLKRSRFSFKSGRGDSRLGSKVYIVWGLKKQNLDGCHPRKFDPDCLGSTSWDEGFDLNPPPAQESLLNLCKKLQTMPVEESEKYWMKRNLVTDRPIVTCFIAKMNEFYKEEEQAQFVNGTSRYSLSLALPTTEIKMRQFMQQHPSVYNTSSIPETFYRYFETAYGYWITDGHTDLRTNASKTFNDMVAEELDMRDSRDVLSGKGQKFGTRISYAAISVELRITSDFSEGLKVYRKWEDFIEKEMKNMTPTVSGGFQTSSFFWHWFHVQEALVRQGVITVVAGVAVAWIVLVLISGNVIVGTMATITIAAITACVVAIIPLAGWKIGVLEAINMTLVVGLSVDYVVHLGVAYGHSPHPDRKLRVKYALTEMGVSVVSGAITTLGSGFFMMFSEIIFFMQFGIFVFATIGFSILFAMTFFLVLLSIAGPQGNTGSTATFFRFLRRKWTGRSKHDRKCPQCKGKGYTKLPSIINRN